MGICGNRDSGTSCSMCDGIVQLWCKVIHQLWRYFYTAVRVCKNSFVFYIASMLYNATRFKTGCYNKRCQCSVCPHSCCIKGFRWCSVIFLYISYAYICGYETVLCFAGGLGVLVVAALLGYRLFSRTDPCSGNGQTRFQ